MAKRESRHRIPRVPVAPWGVALRSVRFLRWSLRRRPVAYLACAAIACELFFWSLGYRPTVPETVGDVTNALLLVVAALTALIALQGHRWNQDRATMALASHWNDGGIVAARQLLDDRYPALRTGPPLTYAQLRQDLADPKLAHALRTVLNHLDFVAVGVEQGMYSPGVARHLYSKIMVNHFRFFEAHILRVYVESPIVAGDETSKTWWYLVRVAARWSEQRQEAQRLPVEETAVEPPLASVA